MTKNQIGAEQPLAKSGVRIKEMYRLYSVNDDFSKGDVISIIGVEGGRVAYTYRHGMDKAMFQSFHSFLGGGMEIKDTDRPGKYFRALEARFIQSSRVILVKTGKEGK